ncbi:MAG: stalk domain-containing protein [Bacillota bacterium]|jgi:spore germination protein
MRKRIWGFCLTVLFCLMVSVSAFAAAPISIYVNDQKLAPDVDPYITSGRTMLPVRAVLEPLGAVFAWDSKTKTVTIQKGAKKVLLIINKKQATINGVKYSLDAPAVIKEGRTFVPLRFVAESFDAIVNWNGAEKTVRITPNAGSGGKKIVTGYYYDANSLESLSGNLDIITDTVHFSYNLNAQGRVEERPFFSEGFELARRNNMGIEMLVFANNREQLKALMDNPTMQQTVINDIYNFLQTRGFDGVNLDFEYIDRTQPAQFVNFVKLLRDKLGTKYTISLSLPAKSSDRQYWYDGYDYKALAAVADRIMVMAYDQHYKGGEPGPVAGNDWVEEVINYMLPMIPGEKFQLGLGIYGYDWPETGAGRTILVNDARNLAAAKGLEIIKDPTSGVSRFNYWDDNGVIRQVWFEDASSVRTKLELVKKYNLAGIAIWRLGIIPQDIWKVIAEGSGN